MAGTDKTNECGDPPQHDGGSDAVAAAGHSSSTIGSAPAAAQLRHGCEQIDSKIEQQQEAVKRS
jgi:hypothetical protein